MEDHKTPSAFVYVDYDEVEHRQWRDDDQKGRPSTG
jgi:hypothetical protein